MKLTVSAITCIVILYLLDAYYFGGLYFKTYFEVMYHIWHGY